MRTRARYLCLLAPLLLGTPADAEQWFAVGHADAPGSLVEVDLESIRARGQTGEGVIRVTFDLPQRHRAGFRYRSLLATAQIDCPRRTIRLTSVAYYDQAAASGARLGSDSSAKPPGVPPDLVDSVPLAARRALLRATCAASQTSSAAL